MNILVTGGAGFIGAHVCGEMLRAGHRVLAVDDFNDFYDPEIKRRNLATFGGGCECATLDIRDAEAVEMVVGSSPWDAIIHLAARAGVRPSVLDPGLYIQTNIVGTHHLLEAARRHGVGRFVFASSSSVYGLAPRAPFREDMPLVQTLSPYAATKLAGEHLCGTYAHIHGLKVVCLRFFTVYGPGQRPDLAIHKFTRAIDHGEPIPQFGDGTTRRDYTYISDIVQGVSGALAYNGKVFDIFNLGENQTTSLRELISHIEQSVGKKARIDIHPEQPGDMPMTSADIHKARDLLGYRPTTTIDLGIPKFVEWYRDNEKRC